MKSDSTTYSGVRHGETTVDDCTVLVNGKELSPKRSQKLHNHSPDGFNWGYCGSGPAQLALAILLDFTDDRGLAADHYMDFKFAHVANWDASKPWSITGQQIREWLKTRGYFTTPKVMLGDIVATNQMARFLSKDEAKLLLDRHQCGDWGEVCRSDRDANDEALNSGARLLSSYTFKEKQIWIITEADRSVTTILFPDEY